MSADLERASETAPSQPSGETETRVGPMSGDTSLRDEEAIEIVRQPPRTSTVIALIAAGIGAVATSVFAVLAIPFGFLGLILVAGGLRYTHSRGWLTVGVAMILTGALISGGYGTIPVEMMILGVGATLVAWDVGQHGISIGHQLGTQTRTRRLEVVHAAATTMVLGAFGLFAYAVYLLGAPGQPAAAVGLALVGVFLLVWTFRA